VSVSLAGLELAHPVLNGSGTLDAPAAFDVLGDAALGCAAHVTKTITPEPRPGNPPPRIAEVPAGLVNSIGLPGPGVDGFRAALLPRLAELVDVPLIVSVGGFGTGDYARVVEELDGEASIAAFELNLSCPNVESGCASIGFDPRETEAVVSACRTRTDRPLLVKLAPTTSLLPDVARAAEAAGAGALVVGNTVPGTVVARGQGRSLLGGGGGGLSGPAIRPVTLRAVLECRAAVAVDLVGLGGVESPRDALDLLDAGACAVGVGTAIFRDPRTPARVRDGLAELAAAAAPGR
jgi:dihydroorotate dehydrogenase (NAD+) catalytic subunit